MGFTSPFISLHRGKRGESMQTVVFDLDGTLADTSGDLINAANKCFRNMGIGDLLHHGQDAAIAVRGGRAMLQLGFKRAGLSDADEIERQYPLLLQAYQQDLSRHTVFYEGAMDAVNGLRSMGCKVAICTNKPEGLAVQLMTDLGVLDYFDALVGADTLPVRKPSPDPYIAAVQRAGGTIERSLMVGDTITDHKTARAVGVPSVLVMFGPQGDEIEAIEADAFLYHYRDLTDLVHRLIGFD